MFVSSYNTYIANNSNSKTSEQKSEIVKKPTSSFQSELLKSAPKDVITQTKLPLNYVSNYKALHNRQKLEGQELNQNPAKMNFSKISSMSSAQIAYSDNTKTFSLIQKPKQTIDQTPKLDKNLPAPAQEVQENFLKNKMVNTYIANENYYRVTA